MVERRPPQAPPASAQHEDTVAIPVKRPASTNGAASGSGSGNGRVLPPMPKDAPSGRSATPPPPPPSSKPAAKPASKPTTQPTTRPAAKPAPKSPPQKAPQQTPPQAKQRPAVTPMPVVPEVDKRAERQAERDAKAAERTAAKEAARRDKEAQQQAKSAAKVKVAEVKESPKPSRRARLRMTRIDPWSVMKTAFLLSIALGIVIVVSVFMVWSVLDAADVWSSINQTVRDVLGGESATSFDIEDYLGTRRVVGFAMIVAAVDVVLLTAIATLGAFLYNMSASLLGGIEVTLAEDK